ncbi:MAG: DUF1565 domain-containing protein [Verrucomicrobiae bacterium]|nr:DUF1565 domain-containing protein [Verrucomicrobiae bacterium]
MKSFRLPIILAALLINVGEPVKTDAAVWFVRTNGDDVMPGTSWPDAKRTVGSALNAAGAGDEIWVAQGTYAGHLILKPDVALYGGFAGVEVTRVERNWTNHLSILWGTTNQVVVSITNSGPATRLDGFTIGGGIGIHGGGISVVGSGPIIANNTIRNNITDGAGAGISIWGFHLISGTEAYFPVITNNVIVDNQAINDEGDGAGIAVVGSSPVIAWNVIARNTATRNGGGIACWRHSFPVIANNFIVANSASYDELTASAGGGGIFASATDLDGRPIPFAISAPVIVNNVIAANGGNDGGGISVVDSLYGAATIANNTIVANNGAGVYWANTSPTNDNNIVAFNARGFERSRYFTNEAVIRFNNVFGNTVLGAPANYHITADRTGTEGNISADPNFANFAIGDFHIQPDSPCVNAGSTALAPSGWPDADSQARVQGSAVDIGADESDGTTWNVPTPVVRVTPTGDDSDGSTWAKAKKTVTGGITQAAATGGEVWVAQGMYPERVEPRAFVRLYGGFAGSETNRNQRNPAALATILDGGGTAPVVYFRNAGYRVSALDGFIVQGGGIFTGGDVFHPDLSRRTNNLLGGGIYCRVSGPMIANSVIRSNSLGSPFNSFKVLGGGLYAYLSHAEITGNTFAHNEVLNTFDGSGGGLYSLRSLARIERNVFRDNRAENGAALYASLSSLHIVRNLIENNSMYNTYPLPVYLGSDSGAITLSFAPDFVIEANTITGNVAAFGGGLNLASCWGGRIVNNLILGNRSYDPTAGGAGWGGGAYCMINQNATNDLVMAHNTFAGNTATASFGGEVGGALAATILTNKLVLANNIIVSNSSGIWRHPGSFAAASLHHNCVFNSNANNYINLAPGPSDLQSDPQFVYPATGDFRLLTASPCIDAGTNLFAAPADFDGVPRPLDGNADGTARWDIGAFEFAHAQVDADGDGMSDAAEVVAGTNPTDAESVLKLSATLLPLENRVALRWLSVTGRTYTLDYGDSFGTTGSWHPLMPNLPGVGEMMEYRDVPVGPTQRYYRLGVRRD